MTDSDALLLRLQMQITRARTDRLGKQLIDETNDRRADVYVGIALVGDESEVLDLDWRRGGIGACSGCLGIDTIELSSDLVRRRNLPPHAMPRREAHGTLGIEIEGVCSGDDDDAAIHR